MYAQISPTTKKGELTMPNINAAYDKAQVLAVHNTKLYQFLQTKKGEMELSAQVLKLGTNVTDTLRRAWKSGDPKTIAEKVATALEAIKAMEDLYDSLYAGGNLPERSYHAFKAECNQLRELLK